MSQPIHKGFRAARARGGLTLVEILIAVAVLSIGMMGICALLPLGIRNTTTAVDRTNGASIGASALESMKRNSVGIAEMDAPDGTSDIIGEVYGYDGGAGAEGPPNVTYYLDGTAGRLTEAIRSFDRRDDWGWDPPAGTGVTPEIYNSLNWVRGFSIPADLKNAADLGTWKINNYTNAIDERIWDGQAGAWKTTGRCWSAVLVPSRNTEPDYNTTYTCQVAVWTEFKPFVTGARANFRDGDPRTITVTDAGGVDIWSKAQPGDYLCRAHQYRPVTFWYKIAAVDGSAATLTLESDFPMDTADDGKFLWIASRYKLVSTYTTVIYP